MPYTSEVQSPVKTAVISFCIDLGLIETNAQRLQMALNLEIVEIERYGIYKCGDNKPRCLKGKLDVNDELYSVLRQRDSEVLRSMQGRQFGTVCHQLCETAVCRWKRPEGGYRRISSVMNNDEHHPALLGRSCDCGAVYKCSHLAYTYLVS